LGHSRPGRTSSKSGYFRYAAESGSKFGAFAAAQWAIAVDGAARDMIQGPKLEPRVMRYELRDYEWSAIKPMLPKKPRGVRRVNDRRVLNGIFWVLRSGAPWRDLPETYGPRTTCYKRFARWRRAGVWDQIMDTLAAGHDAAVQMVDTSVGRGGRRMFGGPQRRIRRVIQLTFNDVTPAGPAWPLLAVCFNALGDDLGSNLSTSVD
jgi:transposase